MFEIQPLGVGEMVGGGIFALLLILAIAVKIYLLIGKKKKKVPYGNIRRLHGKKEKEVPFLGGESYLPDDLLEEIFSKEEEQQTDGGLVA